MAAYLVVNTTNSDPNYTTPGDVTELPGGDPAYDTAERRFFD